MKLMNRPGRAVMIVFAVVGLVLAAPAISQNKPAAQELTAEQIVDRATELNSLGFEAGHAQMTLEVYDRAGEKRERRLDVKSKRSENRGRTLVTLTHPAEVRGQAFLFIENPDGEDDVWMYVPAFNVTRRIEGNQKRGAFLGTHFTYADLESRDIKDATYRKLPDEKIGDHDVYVIEARPKTPAQSDYSRVVSFIRKDDFIPMRIRFFGKDNNLDKTLFVEQLDKTDDGKTYIRRMTARSERGGYTTIIINALDTKTEIADAIFSREQLGR
jgi:outer membrane lipoprotein-sorting protein